MNFNFHTIDVGLKIMIKLGYICIQQVLYSRNNMAIGYFSQLKDWSFKTVSCFVKFDFYITIQFEISRLNNIKDYCIV